MLENRVKRMIPMMCPICEREHEVEERERTTTLWIKGEEVEYREVVCVCGNSDANENEFETGKMMNMNLMRARNAYRKKHGLLTSEEIVGIRELYGLSQVELARLLGWGEATVSRYESKAIQDESYDNLLRIIRDNPLKAMEFLEKNSVKFEVVKKQEIRKNMIDRLEAYGKEYVSRQPLICQYANYMELSEENGYAPLSINKIEAIASYYAERVSELYKIKFMKMLWYADAWNYKLYGRSMTGLVYRHERMGALPVGHQQLMNLDGIHVLVEEDYESTRYHICMNPRMDGSWLCEEEKRILDQVVYHFKDMGTKEIVAYMHGERAYRETKTGEIIPFKLAGEVRDFS